MQEKLLAALNLLLSSSVLWGHQKKAIEKLLEQLKQGCMRGLIKHPTGAGKTTLFCSIAKEVGVSTLILVPRTGLLDQVYATLRKVGVAEDSIVSSGRFSGTVEAMLHTQGSRTIVLMTYQGLLSLKRTNPDLLTSFRNNVSLLIADEGHTALGKKTKEAVEGRNDEEDLLVGDEDERREVKDLLNEFSCFELFITATPVLLQKTVQDVYGLPIIDYLRYEDLAKTGVLIVPQVKSPGKAVLYLEDEDIPTSQVGLDSISHRFLMEDGSTVQEAVLTLYLEEYDRSGYLPGVVFCKDIASAEAFIQYARALRPVLQLVRCTGGNEDYAPGVSLEDAKRFIEEEGGDLVVTVDKAGLGWDVPTLRASLVTIPLLSSARYLQGPVGRIGRSLHDPRFPEKNRENTIIIEPEWYLEERTSKGSSADPPKGDEDDDEFTSSDKDVPSKKRVGLFHGYHHLYEQGELSQAGVVEYFGKEALSTLPHTFWTKEQWVEHFKLQLSVERLCTMTSKDAIAWKDSTYGFGLRAAYTKVGGKGDPVAFAKDRYAFGVLLHPDSATLKKLYAKAQKQWEQKQNARATFLPVPTWTEEQWIGHLKPQFPVEKLSSMTNVEAYEWKDSIYGFGLIAACRKVGGTGDPLNFSKNRYAFGLLLHPDSVTLRELYTAAKEEWEEKQIERATFLPAPRWTEEQWIAHLKPQLPVDRLSAMTNVEALEWKDSIYGFGLRAACRKVGGTGNPLNFSKNRYAFGLLLHPDSAILKDLYVSAQKEWEQKQKKQAAFLPVPRWTEEQWIVHLKLQLPVERLSTMTTTEVKIWKDSTYGFGLIAAFAKVGGKGDPIHFSKDRYAFGLLLHPDSAILKDLYVSAQKEWEQNKNAKAIFPPVPRWTEEQWIVHLKLQLSAERLCTMTHNEAITWRESTYGFGLTAACSKVGGKGNPVSYSKDRYAFGLLIYPDSSKLQELYTAAQEQWEEKQIEHATFLPVPTWTTEEWLAHLKLQLSVERLRTMTQNEAKKWKDSIYGFGLKAAYAKVAGKGDPIGFRKERLQLGLLLHGTDPHLLAALEEYSV